MMLKMDVGEMTRKRPHYIDTTGHLSSLDEVNELLTHSISKYIVII